MSLRAVTSDNFVVIDITGKPEVIGEVDFSSALTTVHEKAIYLHGGEQYHVEHLDFRERKAYVKQVEVDYYTDAVKYTQVRVLEVAASQLNAATAAERAGALAAQDKQTRPLPDSGEAAQRLISHRHSHGDVLVRSQVVGFKKIKFFSNENIGAGKLELPENEMHTTSYWLTLDRGLVESLPYSISERQSGMFGLLHAMESVATLLLMCDRRDLGMAIGERPPKPGAEGEAFRSVSLEEAMSGPVKEFFEPNLYLFDAYPGGIGFSEPLFRVQDLLMTETRRLIAECGCDSGCPSCVGRYDRTTVADRRRPARCR